MSMVGESGGPVMSGVGRGVVRVKSKVTRVVADSPPQPSSASSSPPPPSTRNGHGRTPSIPTISIASPLFPISGDTSPAASHYRSPATPDSPTRRTPVYQPFPHHDDLPGHNGGKADPALIPLPPQSPPMSTISFSSRSSVSYDTQSSGVTRSTAPTVNSRVNGHARVRDLDRISVPRAGFDSGPGLRSEPASREPSSASEESLSDSDSAATNDSSDDDDDGEDAEDPDRKIKDEAKSNRKIADLEITNKSLLAINSSLEAAKHRQAKEIRDLKRKLRETRLTLPPPAFHAVKHDDTVDEDVEGAEDEDEDDEDVLEGKDDEAFQRVRGMIEGLLDACQRALETKPSDFIEHGRGGAKVLTAEEVRSWRGDVPESEADTRSLADADDDDDAEPSPAAGPSNHVEASPLRRNEGVPPITVTSS
ncbi:hypothetical protein WOLCODRAFT_135573 [Wolfiporia cocos MD-104 SS10]|uniref:Uncharacterized protein n=1 Tax=Wolfiporia cocos (strain MD-104) TaxID=742152 RepID=A0A2H3J367_WOLCO|nr:hypothetical protein WOLCODRAFT_135573 [Wolfiporia cocos MD-104 SS10]